VSKGRIAVEPMENVVTHRTETAFVFDLDGTLVDSVYQHVLAWHEALTSENVDLSVWRIHRKIGMSGGLFTNMLLRETGAEFDARRIERVQNAHAEAYKRNIKSVRPLPGARDLLHALRSATIPFAIATSSRMETAAPALDMLGFDFSGTPIITRDQVKYAKPEPDLFLTAAERLHVGTEGVSVVGDSVWDMLAATRGRFLGIGLLSGGYGREELERSGAYRVFADPADLLKHLDEVGGRR
jgi:phosphoglycolate phosphatase-like HAD superfamily hydrolase